MINEFRESQQFRQWWLWLLLSPVIFITIYVVIYQLFLGVPVGSNPMPDIGVYILVLFTSGLIFLLLYLRLDTLISKSGIEMRYRPFLHKKHSWEEIERVELYDYGFVGYGFRWWPKHGWIYNVSGSKGIKIYLQSGKYYTIGTQKPNELEAVISKYTNYSSSIS